MTFRAGDWVEVRSKEEILQSLGKNGQLENLPFMPQMFQYCGKQFKVYKRAHKTCDTVNPIRSLRIPNAVHLDLRCDGEAYGGCQAACLIFWKTAWLKPVNETGEKITQSPRGEHLLSVKSANTSSCTEADVWAVTYVQDQKTSGESQYVCQATQVPHFGTYLPWWDYRQYLEDYTCGNTTLAVFVRGIIFANYMIVINAGIGLGAPLRWLYDRVQSLWGGLPLPGRPGTIPVGQPTPTCTLNLQPGELVRVKPYKQILATLNMEGKNQGLSFDAEMAPYCGGVHRVRARVNRFIDEKTGKLVSLRSVAVILEGGSCQARYSACRMFCPRNIYAWWREIWLERVPEMERSIPQTEAGVVTSPKKKLEGSAASQA